MNRLQNQKRIRKASEIFLALNKGLDREIIKDSISVLAEARVWANKHDMTDDENNALWWLYECYSRIEQYLQAIEALQTLRINLEITRSFIFNPRERAGVMHGSRGFPRLFRELCRLCYRMQRVADLLDAMEAAKGRALAEVLAQKGGRVLSGQLFPEPTQYLPSLMQQATAHYLSYFMDDEQTYAVLVAKDGSLHAHAIALGKKMLREWAIGINPRLWGKCPDGPDGLRVPKDLPDQLAPLVSWLEPLVHAGLLQRGDHLCYCPDEELHLVPLHYITFLGQPLVRYFSLSRIHDARTLLFLLQRAPERPNRFTALQVPTRQDLTDREAEKKLRHLAQAPNWLAEHFSGQVIRGEHADWHKVAELDWRYRVAHFAMHGTFPDANNVNANRDPNPYSASGLVLAKDGQSPDLTQVFRSSKAEDTLLTPLKVLDLDFSGSHISLMACVSGLAREGIAGDPLGLEWAFLQAGATSVLGTHWNIPASASAEFSLRFYQKWLVDKLPRATSWRESVLELMDVQRNTKHPHSYYWAGFSLSGDWR